MRNLTADNRDLLAGAKSSYLNANYLSGITSLVITNSDGYVKNDYVLLGNLGSETTEIVQVNAVTAGTHTLDLTSATKFAHSESTKVTIIKYNQVGFYHTATTTFSSTSPISSPEYIDIQPDDFYTRISDTTNTTGYGWFRFYNSTTLRYTTNSNAIPYGGFEGGAVKTILDSFFSLLNNKELKLITNTDAFEWLNEGYAIAQNELNLVNKEYTTSDETDVSIVSGTKEYDLDSTFSDLISLYNGTDDEYISKIELEDVPDYDNSTANTPKYYLRGKKIGFSPTPTSSTTYKMRFTTKSARLTSYSDSIDFPDNNFYCLKDYMLFRAAPKLNKGDGQYYFELFMNAVNRMKLISFKRDSNLDSWGISDEANN
jgi:hypothetical protein